MHKVPLELFLVNILVSVNKIIRHSKNLTYLDFKRDEKIFGFLTRELQEIGESVNKISKGGLFPPEEHEKWQKVVDFRNIVVHKYFGVHPETIFEIIIREIPLLKRDILDLVRKLKNKTLFFQALSDTNQVYSDLERYETVSDLEEIEKMLK